jgi:hypothetical protein
MTNVIVVIGAGSIGQAARPQGIYKYYYHATHRLSASIVSGNYILYMQIEEMTESVEFTKG